MDNKKEAVRELNKRGMTPVIGSIEYWFDNGGRYEYFQRCLNIFRDPSVTKEELKTLMAFCESPEFRKESFKGFHDEIEDIREIRYLTRLGVTPETYGEYELCNDLLFEMNTIDSIVLEEDNDNPTLQRLFNAAVRIEPTRLANACKKMTESHPHLSWFEEALAASDKTVFIEYFENRYSLEKRKQIIVSRFHSYYYIVQKLLTSLSDEELIEILRKTESNEVASCYVIANTLLKKKPQWLRLSRLLSSSNKELNHGLAWQLVKAAKEQRKSKKELKEIQEWENVAVDMLRIISKTGRYNSVFLEYLEGRLR